MKRRYYEDFQIGETIRTDGVTVTEAMIVDFALRFDPQAIHLDKEAAERGFYKGLIASGWMVGSLSFRLLVQSGFLHGGSLGSPGLDTLRWVRPVRPGDTIHTEVTVTDTRLSSKGDRGYATLDYQVKNQRGETVMSYLGTQILATRPESATLTPRRA
jgi:acyl dehydratase